MLYAAGPRNWNWRLPLSVRDRGTCGSASWRQRPDSPPPPQSHGSDFRPRTVIRSFGYTTHDSYKKIWSPGSHLYERFILSTEAIVYVIPLNNTCIHRQSDAYLDKELHMLRNPYFCENEYSRSKNMHKETTETAATSQQSWPGSQS